MKKNEVSLSLQEKHLTVFITNEKNVAFKGILGVWKTFMCNRKLDSFPIIKDFPDEIIGDTIGKSDFFILHNKMCVHLENLHNSVNQCFPNDYDVTKITQGDMIHSKH